MTESRDPAQAPEVQPAASAPSMRTDLEARGATQEPASPNVAPEAAQSIEVFRGQRPRLILGPGLWILGVLL